MQKKLLLIATLQNLYMFAPPKGFKSSIRKQDNTENRISTVAAENKYPVFQIPNDTAESSKNFLSDYEDESNKASETARHTHQDDDTFVVEKDAYDTTLLQAQTPQTWMVLFFDKYYRPFHEQCLFQKFCQQIGLTKKYTILDKLREKGQLTNYIDELNAKRVMTGDSLLNEALCEAIEDDQRDIVINLLKETLLYANRLSKKTKQRIDSFLEQDNSDKQTNISTKIGEYLERVRLTTQIRHALNEKNYRSPNLVTITAAVYAHVKTLTDGVVNNTLPIEKQETK